MPGHDQVASDRSGGQSAGWPMAEVWAAGVAMRGARIWPPRSCGGGREDSGSPISRTHGGDKRVCRARFSSTQGGSTNGGDGIAMGPKHIESIHGVCCEICRCENWRVQTSIMTCLSVSSSFTITTTNGVLNIAWVICKTVYTNRLETKFAAQTRFQNA